MIKSLQNMLVNEDGATLVEYGLVVSLIAVACIFAIGALSSKIQAMFSGITAKV